MFAEFGLLYECTIMNTHQHNNDDVDKENVAVTSNVVSVSRYAHVRFFSRSSALFAKAALHHTYIEQWKITAPTCAEN